MTKRPAVFLDCNGTTIESVHDPADPDQVRLIREARYACIVVSNQSGAERALLTIERRHEAHCRGGALLPEQGTVLNGFYFYLAEPTSPDDRITIDHSDRKSAPGMLLPIAENLSRSWMIGDMISDVLATKNAVCRGERPGPYRAGQQVVSDYPDIVYFVGDMSSVVEIVCMYH